MSRNKNKIGSGNQLSYHIEITNSDGKTIGRSAIPEYDKILSCL